MARGKGKAKQNSLRAAGMLPMLKKPAEAVGHYLHVPGAFWDKCPAADKEKSYKLSASCVSSPRCTNLVVNESRLPGGVLGGAIYSSHPDDTTAHRHLAG